MPKPTAPYGAWTSTITAAQCAKGTRRFGDLTMHDGAAFWCEGRPEEDGRGVIVMARAGGEPVDLLPAPYSARSKVHEYGGGAFLPTQNGVFFVNGEDQDIYHLSTFDGPKIPRRITRAPHMRFADGAYDAANNRLIMVAERHPQPDETGSVDNLLVAISLAEQSIGRITPLAEGRDFYAAPRLAPDGRHMAWLEWSLPAMPWEASELWLGELDGDGALSNPRRLAGGADAMAGEPQWDAQGRLWFIADDSGWASLHHWDGIKTTALPHADHEFGQPMWGLGARTYLVGADGAVTAAAQHHGRLRLLRHDSAGWREVSTKARQIESLAALGGDTLAIAASDHAPPGIMKLESGQSLGAAPGAINPDNISIARPLSFPTAGGKTAHALYYAPQNSRCTGREDEKPPMLVSAHGGPTGMADRGLKMKIQYWTSRGFAWLDVDYRGSIGHGRAYRTALDGQWGIADVEDIAAGANHAAEAGLADPARLLITGSSAGGYTVLRALCETSIFAAGASYYGIGDLAKLLALTHKFESGYLHTLLGLTPENADDVLKARSPLFHANQITSPVIFFQGADDAVVPPGQSRDMAASLRARGTPVAYVEFEGEGHGFRRASSIITALESEYAFYARILGLEPEQQLPPLTIDNLPQ